MSDILTARAVEALPPPVLTPALRCHLIAGHRAAVVRLAASACRLRASDPAAHARLTAEVARLRADIAELEAL